MLYPHVGPGSILTLPGPLIHKVKEHILSSVPVRRGSPRGRTVITRASTESIPTSAKEPW